MKPRLGVLVVLAVLSTLLVAGWSSPASAAGGVSARLSANPAIVGEYVKISGYASPATRAVQVQTYRSGRWVGVVSTRSTSTGAYAAKVRVYGTASYRVYAPATKVKRKKYGAVVSSAQRLTVVRPTLWLAAQVVTGDATADAKNVVATFTPARPGTLVYLRRSFGPTIAAKQDAAGHATFSSTYAPAGTADAPNTYSAYATPGNGVATVNSAAATAQFLPTSAFRDDFSGGSSMQFRPADYAAGRNCAQPSADMTTYDANYAYLGVQRDYATPVRSGCKYGMWKNAAIGSPTMVGPNGFYAARVKFQTARGMHGAFWLQGAGSEIDVSEYFGDNRPLGGLASFVHQAGSSNIGDGIKAGGELPIVKSMLGANGPSRAFHVYSVQWTPQGYTFRVDGVPTFQTTDSRLLSSQPSQIVLSLLTSDWELPELKSPTSKMVVDWVGAWQ